MNTQGEREPFYTRKLYRLFSGGFGLFLIGVGVYALFFTGDSTMMQIVGGIALVLLGFNMVISAFRARESLISRLGPLP